MFTYYTFLTSNLTLAHTPGPSEERMFRLFLTPVLIANRPNQPCEKNIAQDGGNQPVN